MENPILLSPNVTLMGNGHCNYYLTGKNTAALIEGGTSSGAVLFARQWEQLSDKPLVKYIVILHSHFDHVGGLPILKNLFPQARVVASVPAQKALMNEKFGKFIADNNTSVAQVYLQNRWIDQAPAPYPGTAWPVDITVRDGDQLELDTGFNLQFLDASGHSNCSIAAYLPADQVMLISDAAGTWFSHEFVAPSFFYDYDLYLQTLKKLSAYPAQAVGLGHGKIPVGSEECRNFYDLAIANTQQTYDYIASCLAAGEDEAYIAQKIYQNYTIDTIRHYPYATMLSSFQLMVNIVKKHQPTRRLP